MSKAAKRVKSLYSDVVVLVTRRFGQRGYDHAGVTIQPANANTHATPIPAAELRGRLVLVITIVILLAKRLVPLFIAPIAAAGVPTTPAPMYVRAVRSASAYCRRRRGISHVTQASQHRSASS